MTLYVFDLDGTVLDTEYEISTITADLLRGHGYATTADEVFTRYGGLSFSAKFNKIAGDQGKSFTAEQLKAIKGVYEERKKTLYGHDGLPAVAGVPALLRRLAAGGNLLAIGSSNETPRSAQGLASGHLLDYFNGRIYGPDLVGGLKKPDPAIYNLAIRENGSDPRRTVIVDDSEPGIKAGHAAGAFVVGYLDPRFGAAAEAKRAQFLAAGASIVISSFDGFESQVQAVRPGWLLRQP